MLEHNLQRAHFGVAQVAFAIGTVALMQSLSRANLPLSFRSPQLYYLSVTAHGVLLASVFTTFFIMGLVYLFARTTLNRVVSEKMAWISFWIAVVGTAITTIRSVAPMSARGDGAW